MNRRVLLAGLISFVVYACNPTPDLPASTPTGRPTGVPVNIPSPTLVPTAMRVQLTLRVTNELVNCRYGPGMLYELVNELKQGMSARVLGRNDTSTWWYIRDPGNPDGTCWVSAQVTEIRGNGASLPVFQPPATYVTKMSLRVEPDRVVVNCSQFPQTFFFEAEIAANGPALVNWQWEASTGVISDLRTLVFEEAGTKVINEYYQVGGPNDYWVKLHILSPNELSEQANFRAACAP